MSLVKVTKEVDGKKYLHKQWEIDAKTEKPNGEYKQWNENGVLVNVSEYKNDVLIKEKLWDGDALVWTCKEWFPHSRGSGKEEKLKCLWSEKISSRGEKKVGKYTEWWSPENGGHKKVEYNYSPCGSGKLDGEYKEYWRLNGKIYFIGHFKDGKMHGKYASWWMDGEKNIERNYKNGKEHGIERKWDGKKYIESNWKDGKCHGTYKKWDDEILVDISEFEDGHLLKEKLWDREKCVWNCQEWIPGCSVESGKNGTIKFYWSKDKDGKIG